MFLYYKREKREKHTHKYLGYQKKIESFPLFALRVIIPLHRARFTYTHANTHKHKHAQTKALFVARG